LIERVVNDGKRAADMAKRIGDFSKTAPAQKESLEVNEAIFGVVRLTRAAMSENSVLVKMQPSEGLPHILGDRVQLQQVILNLIMNAIEAISEVGAETRECLISTSKIETDGVLVTVCDSGPGCLKPIPSASSMRSTRPRRTASAWGCRFVTRSSKHMAAGYRQRHTNLTALSFV